MIRFELLDPRPASLQKELEKIQEWQQKGLEVIGFEVTVPALAAPLDLNIDPQHGAGGDSKKSCIWECTHGGAISSNLDPSSSYVFVTVRADLDALGSMAVAADLVGSESSMNRVDMIHNADAFTQAKGWAARPLFEGGFDTAELAAIALAIADFKVPMETRVKWAAEWLNEGVEPEGYREQADKGRNEVRQALENGETTVKVNGSIAVVNSKLRAATSIGYSKAPVVIAINPEFVFAGGAPHRKITICQFEPGYLNLGAVFSELGEGWAGSPTIGGSPQGQYCDVSEEVLLEVVQKHLA